MEPAINGLSEGDLLILADLEKISGVLDSAEVLFSKQIWTYLGGLTRMDYEKYCQLVRLKLTGMLNPNSVAGALESLYFKFGPIFQPTDSLPDNTLARKYEDLLKPTHFAPVYQKFSENERLMIVDITRMQLVLSGDHIISIWDELYEYLKARERGIEPMRFVDLVRASINLVPDDPTTSEENALHLIKQRFGPDFSPSTILPNEEFLTLTRFKDPSFRTALYDNGPFVLRVTMQKTWLGETRPGRVGKMKPEQIRLLVATVNAFRSNYSDYINWHCILENTGFDKYGAGAKQLKEKFFHLSGMVGVETVSDYELYNETTEPGGETWRERRGHRINFPYASTDSESDNEIGVNQPRRAPPSPLPEPPIFSDDQWRRVLGSIPHDVRAPDLDEMDWKGLFEDVGIQATNLSGRDIMDEFYGIVVPNIRCGRFGEEGRNIRLLLKGDNFHSMLVLIGAINEPWDPEAIYNGIRRLREQEIISWSMFHPWSYWGNILFENVKNARLEGFRGNAGNLHGFKSYWRMWVNWVHEF